jgi:hypothetical protein
MLRSARRRLGRRLCVGGGGAQPTERWSPRAGGGEASGATTSRDDSLGGGGRWRRRRRGPTTAVRAEAGAAQRMPMERRPAAVWPHGFRRWRCLGSGRHGHDSAHGRWRAGGQQRCGGRQRELCQKQFEVRRQRLVLGARGKV